MGRAEAAQTAREHASTGRETLRLNSFVRGIGTSAPTNRSTLLPEGIKAQLAPRVSPVATLPRRADTTTVI